MFEKMTVETFRELAREGLRVPVYRRIPAELITPVSAYQALAAPGKCSFLLESTEGEGDVGRHSFLGFDPKLRFESRGNRILLTTPEGKEPKEGDPMVALREILGRFATVSVEGLPMVGGAIGFFSYDAVRLFEAIPDCHENPDDFPDLSFGVYDTIVSFDHLRKTATVLHVTQPEGNPDEAYGEAMKRIDSVIERILKTPRTSARPDRQPGGNVSSEADMDDQAYCRIVERAREYIIAGDIFQVVLSRRFQRTFTAPHFDVYRALRMVNPSPYMFFLQQEDFSVAGSSPERLIRSEGLQVETMPIAGTRPRGIGDEDLRLEKELLADPKEMAEHMMLVDLARNDVGSVAEPGSVDVRNMASIQRLSKVMHIVSRVHGTLRKDRDGLDALQAALPAGTLSGAPKIRAMEIIDELETSRRGLYGGAVCYIDNRGNMDSCIAIRMAVLKDGVATVRAGAGLVYDSVPEKEAEETRHKASAVLEAIQMAEEGLGCF